MNHTNNTNNANGSDSKDTTGTGGAAASPPSISLQDACEAIMAYQEGLAGIDACLDDFMTSLKKLQQDLRMEETRGRFTACEQAIERLTSQVEACAQSFAVIHHHQKGLSQSFLMIEELRAAMQLFEQAMGRYQQQAGNLNRKLYNRDFQATLKSMNELAADSRSQGTYAYRHLTDHDYEILMHEYQTAFGRLLSSNEQNKSHGGDAAEHTRDEAQDEAEQANARKNVRAFLQAAYQLLEETSLTQQEYEGLQRLIEKLVHSRHEARSRFLAAYQSDTRTDQRD